MEGTVKIAFVEVVAGTLPGVVEIRDSKGER